MTNYYYYYYSYYYFLIIFMQSIYSYISDTNHVSRVYLAAAMCSYNVWYK